MEGHREQVKAFTQLLGLESLPLDGKQAASASYQFSTALLATIRPAPVFSQMVQQHRLSKLSAKPRYLDVATGMRLRYLEWGSGEEVVLLLHDVAECADVWAPVAVKLQQRGYHVFALDHRGHGDSQWSAEGRYSLELLAEDVQAFILEKDLYTRPVAVVGCGLGGAVALALAQRSPHLVGAAVVGEFAVPWEVKCAWEELSSDAAAGGQSKGEGHGSNGGSGVGAGSTGNGMRQWVEAVRASRPGEGQEGWQALLPSSQVLPWWGFSLAQGAVAFAPEQLAALLCHPLANLGPEVVMPMAQAAAAAAAAAQEAAAQEAAAQEAAGAAGEDGSGGSSDEAGNADQAEGGAASSKPGSRADPAGAATSSAAAAMVAALERMQRPLAGAVRCALAMLRLPDPSSGSGGSAPSGLSLKMDPAFFLTFDAAALLARMPALRCHLLLLHGERSGWVAPRDALRFASLAAGAARTARARPIPGAGHHLATDHDAELAAALVQFFEKQAATCFQLAPGSSSTGVQRAGPGGQSNAAAAAAAARRPELLDLKPLPQFDSLEQAKKALGPRSIPTPAAIEAELRKLRLEQGGGGESDDENDESGRNQTALAKDPPNYFGFVG